MSNTTELTTVSSTSLILHGDSFERITAMAKIMAKATSYIPKHFRGNESDCMAVIMQSMQWGMNPWSVATKTFIAPNGTISYEAQLVNAVINSIGPLEGRPCYEHFGDWSKVIGKVKEMQSTKPDGGKYYVSNWTPNDEIGLGVICTYKIKGEAAPRQVSVLLAQCWPRFSTQWATDPQQQICYTTIKKVARREFPDVILGVYTHDEFEGFETEREVNPAVQQTSFEQTTSEPATLPEYPSVPFENSFPKWKMSVEKGACTTEDWIATLSKKGTLSEEMIRRINEVKGPIEVQAEVVQ